MKKVHHGARPLDLRAVALFRAAAREGSLTAAGDQLGLTPSAVSKGLRRLEDELGVTLLRRTPFSVTLTAEGLRFLDEAERLLLASERARRSVSAPAATIRRRLRVALPLAFGRREVAPQLALFAERFPATDVEFLLVNNGQFDPLGHDLDIALMVGGMVWPDPLLRIERVADEDAMLCAAPVYAQQFGLPAGLADLDAHRTLGAIDEATKIAMPWRFEGADGPIVHQPRFSLLSNSIEVLIGMAAAGDGIVCAPLYLVADLVRRGQLVPALPQHRIEGLPVDLICREARAEDEDVAAFREILLRTIEARGPTRLLRRLGKRGRRR